MATDKLVEIDHVKDFISREAAIDAECEYCFMRNCSHDCDTIKVLRGITAADVRPVVRGTWLFDRGDVCKCSNCGWETSGRKAMRVNFCPNCGADMRENKEDEDGN